MDTSFTNYTWASAEVKKIIIKTKNTCKNKECMLDLYYGLRKKDYSPFSPQWVKEAGCHGYRRTRRVHQWQKSLITDLKSKITYRNLQTVFIKPSQSDPGLWCEGWFIKTGVRHFNVTAETVRRQGTYHIRSGTFRISVSNPALQCTHPASNV